MHQLCRFTYVCVYSAVRCPSIKLVFAGDKEADLPSWLSDPTLQNKGTETLNNNINVTESLIVILITYVCRSLIFCC